jgi:hypothetical protein
MEEILGNRQKIVNTQNGAPRINANISRADMNAGHRKFILDRDADTTAAIVKNENFTCGARGKNAIQSHLNDD